VVKCFVDFTLPDNPTKCKSTDLTKGQQNVSKGLLQSEMTNLRPRGPTPVDSIGLQTQYGFRLNRVSDSIGFQSQ
jgi:hypothetical protein